MAKERFIQPHFLYMKRLVLGMPPADDSLKNSVVQAGRIATMVWTVAVIILTTKPKVGADSGEKKWVVSNATATTTNHRLFRRIMEKLGFSLRRVLIMASNNVVPCTILIKVQVESVVVGMTIPEVVANNRAKDMVPI